MFPAPRWSVVILCLTFSNTGLRADDANQPAPHSPFRDPPHSYWNTPTRDRFATLLANDTSKALAPQPNEKTQLLQILASLNISETSQLLVYSATSLQSGLILPSNPRALYFNEDTYVGYVPGGRIEVASIDPELGPIFYVSRPSPPTGPSFGRSERCMNCHAGRTTWQLPGLVAESVIPTQTGASLDGFRREVVGHQIPISERLGGWHVTGAHADGPHLGNLMGEAVDGGYRKFSNPPGTRFDWSHYPNHNSDLLTHLIHEHQLGFHNLVTLAAYRTREALVAGKGSIRPVDQTALTDIAHRLTRYVLFADEAPLPSGGIIPEPRFLEGFLSRRIPNKKDISLRDMDLKTRIFRYRCSYMIYTAAFKALPAEMKILLVRELDSATNEKNLGSEFRYLESAEKRAIREILIETQALH